MTHIAVVTKKKIDSALVEDAILASFSQTFDAVEYIWKIGDRKHPRTMTINYYRQAINNIAHSTPHTVTEEIERILEDIAKNIEEQQVAAVFGEFNRKPPVPEHVQAYMLHKHPRILPYVANGVSETIAMEHAPEVWGAWLSLGAIYDDMLYPSKLDKWEELLAQLKEHPAEKVEQATSLPTDLSL